MHAGVRAGLLAVGFAALGGLWMGGGCRPGSDPDEGVAASRQAIQGGAPADIAELMAVVRLGDGELCSGTYLGQRTVLTAAHCLPRLFALGCGPFSPFAVRFASPLGDPHVPPGQLRTAIAAVVHPLAFRQSVVEGCCAESVTTGLQPGHDLALTLLDEEPDGIDPLPVVVGEAAPISGGGVVFDDIRGWLDGYDEDPATGPWVTIAGYGAGSTIWQAPPPAMGGRDFGTAQVVARTATIETPGCLGDPSVSTSYDPLIVLSGEGIYPDHGDSGSPVLAGPGAVKPWMTPPAPLPPGLDPRRHLVGVYSGAVDGKVYAATWAPDNGPWLAERLGDLDADGVGNDEDNCPAVANPGQANCNANGEAEVGVAPVGDACDPVPCVRATQASKTSGGALLEVTTTTSFDVEPIRVAPGPTFSGEWGHRFCECPGADGTPEAVEICKEQHGCAISASFGDNGPFWYPTEVGLAPGPPPALDAAFVHDFAAPAELQPGGVAATLDTLLWHASSLPEPVPFTVTGSHWFHVKKDACNPPQSCPTLVPQQTLDKLASHYWAGEAGRYVALGGVLYEIPQAFSWWLPPPPICPACRAFGVLPFAHLRPDQTLAIRTPAGDYEIESQLTPTASQALAQTTGLMWLAPSEPAPLLGSAPVLLASLALDGSAAGPALQSTPAGVDLVAPRPGSPPPRSRFGAVLRATESDLLVIGGLLPGGQPAGDAWRYPILGGPWTALGTGGVTPGAVLAATYDAYHRRLVVLDEIGAAPSLEARLWRLDIERGAARVLGTWPRTGHYDAFALGHAHDGSFVLLAGRTAGAPLRVLRLQIDSAGARLESLRASKGRPVAPPRTDSRGIHILVDHPGKQIVAERIDWTRLEPAHGKTLADYLR